MDRSSSSLYWLYRRWTTRSPLLQGPRRVIWGCSASSTHHKRHFSKFDLTNAASHCKWFCLLDFLLPVVCFCFLVFFFLSLRSLSLWPLDFVEDFFFVLFILSPSFGDDAILVVVEFSKLSISPPPTAIFVGEPLRDFRFFFLEEGCFVFLDLVGVSVDACFGDCASYRIVNVFMMVAWSCRVSLDFILWK